jgi:hypothetical protein
MALADYAHWNEEATQVWWQEEGKHIEEPPWEDPDFYLDTMGPMDDFAKELEEMDDVALVEWYLDKEYRRKWPKTKAVFEAELQRRGITVR